MASLNKVQVIGYLGGAPDLKYTQGGEAVANFNVATSEKWTDKNGDKQERTEWHRIVVWGKLAELCGEYLGKGRMVFVEGALQTRSYEKDGQTRYVTEIKAREILFLDKAPNGGAEKPAEKPTGKPTEKPQAKPKPAAQYPDEDIPF